MYNRNKSMFVEHIVFKTYQQILYLQLSTDLIANQEEEVVDQLYVLIAPNIIKVLIVSVDKGTQTVNVKT